MILSVGLRQLIRCFHVDPHRGRTSWGSCERATRNPRIVCILFIRGDGLSEGQIALWVTLWLVGAALSVILFLRTKAYGDVGRSAGRARSLILLGLIPCGGANILYGLIPFAIFMAIAVPAKRQREALQRQLEREAGSLLGNPRPPQAQAPSSTSSTTNPFLSSEDSSISPPEENGGASQTRSRDNPFL